MAARPIPRWIKTILILSLIVGVERFCHKKTRGFRPHKIYSHFPYEESFAIAPLEKDSKEKINTILSQPFSFLGDGGQGYSFVSQDGQYVLKLFKLHHVRVPSFVKSIAPYLPFGGHLQDWIKERDKDKERMLSSCKIAYDYLAKETAIVYAHINASSDHLPSVTLYDAIGAIHHIDMDRAVFALQRKADLAFTHLKQDLSRHDEKAAKAAIDDFLTFLAERCQKGVEDRDTGLKRNFGYLDGKLMEIDVGSFVLNPSLTEKEALYSEVAKKGEDLRFLLEEQYPEMLPYYEARLISVTSL